MPHHGSDTNDSLAWLDCIGGSRNVYTIISSDPGCSECIPTSSTMSFLKGKYKACVNNIQNADTTVSCCYFRDTAPTIIQYPLQYPVFLTSDYVKQGLFQPIVFNFNDNGVSLKQTLFYNDQYISNTFDTVFTYIDKLNDIFNFSAGKRNLLNIEKQNYKAKFETVNRIV